MQTKGKSILLIDNDRRFLKRCSDFLTLKGCEVTPADTIEKAAYLLEHAWFHLAIIDWKMGDETEADDSGIELARNAPKQLHKIIQTSFDSPDYSSKILHSNWVHHFVPVYKSKGLEHLWEQVEEKFYSFNINWQLQIIDHSVSLRHLIPLINSDLHGAPEFSVTRQQMLDYHVSELDDLFRMVFNNKDQIKLHDHEWEDFNRVGLQVEASNPDDDPALYWVTVGQNEKAFQEREKHQKQQLAQEYFKHPTTLADSKDSSHYIVNLYKFSGRKPSTRFLTSLKDRYKMRDDEDDSGLDKHFDFLMKEQFPHRSPGSYRFSHSSVNQMIHNVAFSSRSSIEELLGEKIEELTRHLSRFGHDIQRKNGQFGGQFVGQEPIVLPDPLKQDHSPEQTQLPFVIAPGHMKLENLLADQEGRVWLTDFYTAGEAPLCWVPANIEAIIRYDTTDHLNLAGKIRLEKVLLGGDKKTLHVMGGLPETSEELEKTCAALDGHLATALRRIWKTRKWAAHIYDHETYQLALFSLVARRLYEYNPLSNNSYGVDEYNRFAHLLYSMAAISEHIGGSHPQTRSGLYFNDRENTWYYNETDLSLNDEYSSILKVLHSQPGRLVERDQLTRVLAGGSDINTKNSNDIYLYTIISRLKDKLERASGIQGDQWIEGKRGKGYTFHIPPETHSL